MPATRSKTGISAKCILSPFVLKKQLCTNAKKATIDKLRNEIWWNLKRKSFDMEPLWCSVHVTKEAEEAAEEVAKEFEKNNGLHTLTQKDKN